jgi:hypothetical protein
MKTKLSYRLQEVILNGTWIANTNFKAQLQDVNWKKAIEKPTNFNSIAMLTFHIQYYLTGVLHYFETGNLEIRDQFSFEIPIIFNQIEWENLKNLLFTNTEKLAKIIDNLSEKELQEVFVKENYGTVQRNIDGLIEHAYYHLGQLVMVKKMLDN